MDASAVSSFYDLDLPDPILEAVSALGFESPTPIQAQTIPVLAQGKDVVGIAQTGTGKTAAFGLPILAACTDSPEVQALILAPTRELAQQSAQALSDFSAKIRALQIVPVYGGSAYGPQIGALRRGAQVVVGTPGRVIDLLERGELDLSALRYFVLDEADEMLRMGFAEDVDQIAQEANPAAVRALFSATMPPAIEKVANTHLTNPVRVSVAPQSSTVSTVHQTYAVVPFKFKSQALSRVLSTTEADASIVFVRTREDAEQVASDLLKDGFKAAAISGDVPQKERERIVARLRDGGLDVVVATDVAARGLDVERIGLVVNYDVPREPEAYVHRIGRTGRAGREGTSLTFFTPREPDRLRIIEELTGTEMDQVFIPSPQQVQSALASRVLDKIPLRLLGQEMDVYFDALQDILNTTGMDLGDLAAGLLALACGDQSGPVVHSSTHRIRREEKVDEYGRFLSASFEAGRDNPRGRKGSRGLSNRRLVEGGRRDSRRGERAERGRKMLDGNVKCYRIGVGRKDRVRPSAIVGAITGEGGLTGSDIGHIEIMPTFSLVEIPGGLSREAQNRIGRAKIAGRKLRIQEDQGPKRKR